MWWMTLIKAIKAKQAIEAGKGGKGGYHKGDPMALMGGIGLASKGSAQKTQAPALKQGQPTGTMNYPSGRAGVGLTERDVNARYQPRVTSSQARGFSGLQTQDTFWNDTYF